MICMATATYLGKPTQRRTFKADGKEDAIEQCHTMFPSATSFICWGLPNGVNPTPFKVYEWKKEIPNA